VVPRLIGVRLATARVLVGRTNCSFGRVRLGRSIKRRIGKVIGQVPKAGAQRPGGTRVNVVVGRR